MTNEETINDKLKHSLRKALNKYSNSFDGEMEICFKCDRATVGGKERVVFTEFELKL